MISSVMRSVIMKYAPDETVSNDKYTGMRWYGTDGEILILIDSCDGRTMLEYITIGDECNTVIAPTSDALEYYILKLKTPAL